ncbi:MAG: hypothetical protein QM811_26485 [Pirellulales bacterium]
MSVRRRIPQACLCCLSLALAVVSFAAPPVVRDQPKAKETAATKSDERPAVDVAQLLADDEFWKHVERPLARPWSAGELSALREAALGHPLPVVRLRTAMWSTDLAGRGSTRVKAEDLELARAGFRSLEPRVDQAETQALLKTGFTMYGVSRKPNGERWLLIERVADPTRPDDKSGGVNLRYDEKTKTFDAPEVWGGMKP